MLAAGIVEGKDIVGLRQIAPIVEQLLVENDDDDSVSLGFVETLFHAARDGEVDAEAVYGALGAGARSVWDDLLEGERRRDLRAVEYTARDVGQVFAEAALVSWRAKQGKWNEPGSVLADLSVGGHQARLVALQRCLLDRVATKPGEKLVPGTLLCYLAPWERATPQQTRLCTVVEAAV
jgi:hypothetical protein